MISRAEWRWVGAYAAAAMLLTTLPYMAAFASANDEWRFSGFLLAVEDGNSYIAKMAQGAHGAWLFRLPYSYEHEQGALLYAFHLALGKLAGQDHGAMVAAYHAARVVFGIALIVVSYVFLAEFLPRVDQRRMAILLTAFGGGLGWLATLVGRGEMLGSLPVDFISPEAYSFLVLFGLPHLAAARCLLLLGLLAYLRQRPVVSGLALLAASVIQPLSVMVAWLVMGAHAVLASRYAASEGWELPQAVRRLAVTTAISAPLVVYVVYLFAADPVLRQWNAQNQLMSPHPLHYGLAFGVLGVPAFFGLGALWRGDRSLALLAGVWLALTPLLLYAPVPTQRRLIEAVQLPLVALAVLGLTVVLAQWRRVLVPVILGLSFPTAILLWLGALQTARFPAEPIFHSADQVASFTWLARQAQPRQVVLAAYSTGNVLPAYAPLVAYIGHGPETIFLAEKLPRVAAFYAAATSDIARRELLAAGRVSWVIFGPHEKALGEFDPEAASYLAWRFEAGNYRVYEVLSR
jgi:hypothetical protein